MLLEYRNQVTESLCHSQMMLKKLVLVAICIASLAEVSSSTASDYFLYTLKNGEGNICLLLRANISLSFNYNIGGGNQKVLVVIPVPDVNATGSCGNTTDSLNLSWTLDNSSYDLSFTFIKNDKRYNLTEAEFTYNYSTAAGYVNGSAGNNKLNEFSTKLGQNYRCDANKNIPIGDGVSVSLVNSRIQAFINSTSPDFTGAVNDCNPTKPSSSIIVPIAIGAALAGMILFVLAGYFIGRRKTSAKYTEMHT